MVLCKFVQEGKEETRTHADMGLHICRGEQAEIEKKAPSGVGLGGGGNSLTLCAYAKTKTQRIKGNQIYVPDKKR